MTMLQIGGVQFTVLGPHYDALRHDMAFNWPAQGRMGRRDALQFTGEGEETIEVSGAIYTDYYGGFSALQQLKGMARRPQMVISGAGDVFGRFSIVRISNEQTYQDQFGRPAKVTFTVQLMRYGEDGGGFGFRLF